VAQDWCADPNDNPIIPASILCELGADASFDSDPFFSTSYFLFQHTAIFRNEMDLLRVFDEIHS
jgi:hypothetical protein